MDVECFVDDFVDDVLKGDDDDGDGDGDGDADDGDDDRHDSIRRDFADNCIMDNRIVTWP